MAETDTNMHELDQLLQIARQEKPDLPEALEARILRDAARVRAGFAAPARPGAAALWRQLRAALGGWPAMGGLAAACAAGLWLGLAPPAALPDPVMLLDDTSGETLALFSGDDLALAMLEDG